MLTDWLIWLDYLEENNQNTIFLRLATPIFFGIIETHYYTYSNGRGSSYGNSDGNGSSYDFSNGTCYSNDFDFGDGDGYGDEYGDGYGFGYNC